MSGYNPDLSLWKRFRQDFRALQEDFIKRLQIKQADELYF